jgi:NADPH:quinone reductase and related Zn-dependent oxidoreductases
MRVWELRDGFAPEHLRLGERPEPVPGAGQVVVAMRAASLNYRDSLVIRGRYGPRVALPLIPVSDGAGEVVAVGPSVRRVKPGDRVAPLFFQRWQGGRPDQDKMFDSLGGPVDGVLTEQMCLSEDGVAVIPPHLDWAEAATLPCAGLTAWTAIVTDGRVGPGDTVLVQGTGGVALFALQFAKLAGARVIVTSSSDAKLERVRALGADETINYRQTPAWDRVVKEMTGGAGCDHIVELGGAETLERSVRAIRIGGTLSLIGVLSGAAASLALPLVVMRQVRMQGITVGARDGFEAMAGAIGQHGLRPVVDRVFSFDDVPAAFATFDQGAHFGKICIRQGT